MNGVNKKEEPFSLLAYVETSRLTNSPRTINIPSDKREEGKKRKERKRKEDSLIEANGTTRKERKKERKEGRIFLSRPII